MIRDKQFIRNGRRQVTLAALLLAALNTCRGQAKNMKIIICLFLWVLILCNSCFAKKLHGIFIKHGLDYNLKLEVKKNKTFTISLIGTGQWNVDGQWKIKKDTLYLNANSGNLALAYEKIKIINSKKLDAMGLILNKQQ